MSVTFVSNWVNLLFRSFRVFEITSTSSTTLSLPSCTHLILNHVFRKCLYLTHMIFFLYYSWRLLLKYLTWLILVFYLHHANLFFESVHNFFYSVDEYYGFGCPTYAVNMRYLISWSVRMNYGNYKDMCLLTYWVVILGAFSNLLIVQYVFLRAEDLKNCTFLSINAVIFLKNLKWKCFYSYGLFSPCPQSYLQRGIMFFSSFFTALMLFSPPHNLLWYIAWIN